MGPVLDPVVPDAELPKRSSVVVVGGGIVGVATALELTERGVEVTLLEKGEIGCEQSSRNWGWCRQMGRDPREMPLIIESLRLWRKMNERVEGETGYRQCGIVYLCETEAELAAKERWYEENARPYQLDTRVVGTAAAAELVPGSAKPWTGALYTASDGRAEPQKAAPALARAAQRRGAKIFTGCAVRGIETAAGRVSGVVTERGAIACDAVVLAGGAWSRRFCHNAGVSLPQLTVINSVQRTEPIDTGIERTASGAKFTLRKRLDGGYTITHQHFSIVDILPDSFRLFTQFLPALMLEWKGLKLRLGRRFVDEARLARRWQMDEISPFEHVRILDPEPVHAVLDEATENLKDHYPAFREMRVAQRWAGCIDATPDAVPVISPVEDIPGFFLATGFSGHGFGIGPGAGRLAADLVTGKTPCVDPAPFRFRRFSDGSNPRPMTGL